MLKDINHGEGSKWADCERELVNATDEGNTSVVEHTFIMKVSQNVLLL